MGSEVLALDFGEEAVPATMHSLDGPLRGAIVVDSPAGLLDTGGQSRLGDKSVAPDVVEELLFRDESPSLFHQIPKNAEDLRLDLADAIGSDDLDSFLVDDERAESKARHRFNARTR